MRKQLNIDTSQTPEKFLYLTDEILNFLTDKLQALNKLEEEIFKRSSLLKDPKNPNQLQPGEKDLWAEYSLRYKEIVEPISLKQTKEGRSSFGKPTKYEYLSYPNTKITFIMKSATRAVIEMLFENGVEMKEQFVLKKVDDNWKIDTKKYSFPDENTWWKDII